jgi:hypothetical protein
MNRTVVTFTIGIDTDGNVTNDTQPYSSTFAEVYRAFHAIKAERRAYMAMKEKLPDLAKQVNEG